MIREAAVRCEKPQGVVRQPGAPLYVNGKAVTMFHAPESGREYMRIEGENGESWFRISKTIHCAAA